VARPAGAGPVDLDGSVHAAWSDASWGDLRPTGPGPHDGGPLADFATEVAAPSGARFDQLAWATQVHGRQVVAVWREPSAPGGRSSPPVCRHVGEADALVAVAPGTSLVVLTADCAPLALASPEGVFAAVHAGWRGLVAGVVDQTVRRMRDLGATDVRGVLGPCIHAGCYEFGDADLDTVSDAFGPSVRGTTRDGAPALDLVAGVRAATAAAGAELVGVIDSCTACAGGQFSHRARADRGRQALVVWSTHPWGSP
jgi:YfiH family protein